MRLGFDVGGTKTDGVIVAPDGEIVSRLRRPTGWGAAQVVATITDLAADLVQAAGVRASDVRSIGVGMPGQVAPGSGTVRYAVNLGIDELDLGRTVGDALGVPVRAENDVKAAALGAHALYGAQAGADGAMAYLNLGTGVAAGFVFGGELWRGARGAAGEIGHLSVDPRGPRCTCGQRGCIEAYCGGGAIAARWGRDVPLPVLDVFDHADAGDPLALELRAGLVYGVASAIRVIMLSGDAEKIVLGGGVTALGARMLGLVKADLAESAAVSSFLRSLHLADRVELLPPGSPAAALGAALVGAAPVAPLVSTPSPLEGKAVLHG